MAKKDKKKSMPKLRGVGLLNEKHQIFDHKNSKRKKTRERKDREAIDRSKDQ
jgi:hypothetical protein